MVRNAWCVLCRTAIENKKTNNVSLIEHLEKLTVNLPPDAHEEAGKVINFVFGYTLASLWYNDGDKERKGVISLSVSVPTGDIFTLAEQEIILKAGGYGRMYWQINSFPLVGEGHYRFDVHIKEDEMERRKRVATIPLRVTYNIREDAPFSPIQPFPDDAQYERIGL